MKKVLPLLVIAALALSLTACGSSSPENRADDLPSDVVSFAAPSDSPEKGEGAQIEASVLWDEAGVKITAESLDTDSLFGPELKLLFENDSGRDLTFQCYNASVNGYMVETLMSVDVANGKKANDSLTFLSVDLDRCGIEAIADMEFSLLAFDAESWDAYLDTPPIRLKTSLADTYSYTYDDSGEVVYNENGIKVVFKGLVDESDTIIGPGIKVYLENNSSQDISIQAWDVSVNGHMAYALFSPDVPVGKRAVSNIAFFASDLEKNGITDIETVELSFHIFDLGTFETILDTDAITLTF